MQGLGNFFKVPVAVGFFRDWFNANDFLRQQLMTHTIGH
jgi:hypothetical protein